MCCTSSSISNWIEKLVPVDNLYIHLQYRGIRPTPLVKKVEYFSTTTSSSNTTTSSDSASRVDKKKRGKLRQNARESESSFFLSTSQHEAARTPGVEVDGVMIKYESTPRLLGVTFDIALQFYVDQLITKSNWMRLPHMPSITVDGMRSLVQAEVFIWMICHCELRSTDLDERASYIKSHRPLPTSNFIDNIFWLYFDCMILIYQSTFHILVDDP